MISPDMKKCPYRSHVYRLVWAEGWIAHQRGRPFDPRPCEASWRHAARTIFSPGFENAWRAGWTKSKAATPPARRRSIVPLRS